MIATTHELLVELRARGLAAEGPAAAEPPAHDRPWYIGLILGAAGWFAGIFMLIFVMMLFKPNAPGGALLIGAILIASAWGLYKADREGAFVSQLALAFSIAGQFAVVFGMQELFFKGWREIPSIAFAAFVLQAALALVMPNRLHRTLSTLFACIAWTLFVRYALWDRMPSWGGGGDTRTTISLSRAIAGWLCAWFPAGGLLYYLIRSEPAWMASGREAIARPVAVGLILGLAFGTLISQPFESFAFILGHYESRPGWLSLWPLLSAAASVVALAAAFALGRPGLMGACILAALLHLSHFYYTMGTTLLVKSVTMLVIGGVLLAAARALGETANMTPARILIALGAALVLGAINFSIVAKESIKRGGDLVYLDLTPRDPRSLMQGDYMVLRFVLANEIEASWAAGRPAEGEERTAAVMLDDRRVAHIAKPGATASHKIRYRMRKGTVWLGTNAFFFEEGSDKRFAAARYGEFRVDPASGEAVLVGLRDTAFKPL